MKTTQLGPQTEGRPFLDSTCTSLPQPPVIPMTAGEMAALGWDELDVLLISGDAYVDHPSFGIPLLARVLVAHGFRTGLIAQPDWKTPSSVMSMGRPRLFCGIGAGAVDSMLAHYSAFRQKRRQDAYTPGGIMGARPNRALIVYANLVRQAFSGLPVVLGGIEASTRRVTHYDFWSDQLRRPLLFDARADLLVYGMGERALVEIAQRRRREEELPGIPGTAWISPLEDGRLLRIPDGYEARPHVRFPDHEMLLQDPRTLMTLALEQERQVHQGLWACERVQDRAVVIAEPSAPLTTEEMDALYELPFTRKAHPSYTLPVPAEEMMRTSITSHRGCGGGCSFCSISLHQGRRISSRSEASLMREARRLARQFSSRRGEHGVAISDVGGPTANMWMSSCERGDRECVRRSCCFPRVCPFFRTRQREHVAMLRAIRRLPGVKQVRIASGIRADLAIQDRDCLLAYTGEFTGGQLKLAPEHCVPRVLRLMRKPDHSCFETFLEIFLTESRKRGLEQYIVPYLLSGFPGCTDADMLELGKWLASRHWTPKQTQCFVPTPGTVATAMFYAGTDEDGNPIPVARTDRERVRQHRVLQDPETAAQQSGRRNRSGEGANASSPHRNSRSGKSRGQRNGKTG